MIDYAGLQNGLLILGGILSMGYMTYRYFTHSRREANKDTNEGTQNNAGVSNNTNEQTQNTEGVVNNTVTGNSISKQTLDQRENKLINMINQEANVTILMNTTDSIEVLQAKLEVFNETINKTLITDLIKTLKMNSIYLTKLKKIIEDNSFKLSKELETHLTLIFYTDDNIINHLHNINVGII